MIRILLDFSYLVGYYSPAKNQCKNKGFIMARTTNEDTLPFVDSRYELGMLGAQRVRDLNGGAEPVVEVGRDKPEVVALREIATGKLDVDNLRHELVQSYKNTPSMDATETSLETTAEDPLLKELDAELADAIIDEDPGINAEVDEEIKEGEIAE
jgi:DNA-directed RNA polymerase subunit omega